MYHTIRAILLCLHTLLAASPWARLPTLGPSVRSPVILALENVLSSFFAIDATGDVVFASDLWDPYYPDPYAEWTASPGNGFWTFRGAVNASFDGPVLPYTTWMNLETTSLPFVGPIFEDHPEADSVVFLEPADNLARDAADHELVVPTDYEDPDAAQRQAIVWSVLSFILFVSAVIVSSFSRSFPAHRTNVVRSRTTRLSL